MPWGRYSSRYRDQSQVFQQQQAASSAPQDVRIGPGAPPRAVAKRTFGEATVTCCIRGAHSKWGKHHEQDAAILHFMISASQPKKYKLQELQLRAEFSTMHSSVGSENQRPATPEPELYLLDQPSPKWVGGSLSTRKLASGFNAQPAAEGAGISVGLGSITYSEEREVQRSWIFRSGWDSSHHGLFDIASWIWEANTDNPQVDDRGALYAALALRYPVKPFYLCTSVEGKLTRDNTLRIFRLTPDNAGEPHTVRLVPTSSDEDLSDEVMRLEEHIVNLNLQPAGSMTKCIVPGLTGADLVT